MQLHKVDLLTCDHAKTVFSRKDFSINMGETDVIVACLKCKEWAPVKFV